MKQLAADEAESEDEFIPLDLKLRINNYFEENPKEKKIPSEVMSEAFRWRLSQNDCQNRGYILDGYPLCYNTSLEVFFITPEQPKPKEKKFDNEGNEIEEEEPAEELDPEELAKKYAPKFQSHIYPDSVILMRGSDDYLRNRARELKPDDNKKWDPENLERRLQVYRENNDINLF
jgi:adenylate kinase